MSAVVQENLEERIERIRKRDEEIEKRHREAEADRLMALKDNAMVKTKPPNNDDWPLGHKYDTLDFTYDQKEPSTGSGNSSGEERNGINGQKREKSNYSKPGRDYKKFADGEGPPPDPSYNFLADAERDGSNNSGGSGGNDKKDWRSNSNNGNTGSNGNRNGKNGLNNSFRGRNNGGNNNKSKNGGNNNGNNNSGTNGSNNNRFIANPNGEYNSWKNERERIDEARIGRQKVGDGKWRREWDTDKHNNGSSNNCGVSNNDVVGESLSIKLEKINVKDIGYNNGDGQIIQQKSPNHHHNHMTRSISQYSELPMEKRGNIMVSVSQDGEVKSVKLQSTRAIGTGRVGPRQNVKPQFSIQKETVAGQQPILGSQSDNHHHQHQQQQQQNLHQQQQQQPQQHHTHHQSPHYQNHNFPDLQPQYHAHAQYYQQTQQQQQLQSAQTVNYQQSSQLATTSPLTTPMQRNEPFFDVKIPPPIIGNLPISPPTITKTTRPLFDGRPNLQDRLNRHRQNANNNVVGITTNTSNKQQQPDNTQIALAGI